MSRVLITGISGFLGTVLADALQQSGHLVAGYDLVEPPPPVFVASFFDADICDGRKVKQAVRETRPDVVYHLAAESHIATCQDEPDVAVDVNVVGTHTLLDAVREEWPGARVVLAGSAEEYGEGCELTTRAALYPKSMYGATKAAAAMLARGYAYSYKMNTCVARMANLYGPSPSQDARKFVPLLISRLLAHETVELHSGGAPTRDWLFVDNAVATLIGLGFNTAFFGAREVNVPGYATASLMSVAQAVAYLLDMRFGGKVQHRDFLRVVPPESRGRVVFMEADPALNLHATSLTVGLERTIESFVTGRSKFRHDLHS